MTCRPPRLAEPASGRTYNVGEQVFLAEAEWVLAIGRAVGWSGQVVTMPCDRLPEDLREDHNACQHLLVDSARIRDELGFRESCPQAEAIARTAEWELTNPPEEPPPIDYAREDRVLSELSG